MCHDYLRVFKNNLVGQNSVPVSQLSKLVYETKADLANAGIRSAIVGHVGDGESSTVAILLEKSKRLGNFHTLLLFHDDRELPAIRDAVHRMVHRAIALDGTCMNDHICSI